MPYWRADEPYADLIRRDPKPLRIGFSHQWGPYGTSPEIIAELMRAARFLEGLGHHVEEAQPAIDYEAAFKAQTTCYITNFAQTIALLLEPRGLTRPPEGLVEPMNIRLWAAGIDATYSERTRMQLAFNTASRGFGAFFERFDIILTPTMAKPTPRIGTTEYLTVSDEPDVHAWFANLWGIFAYTPLANLCGIPGLSMPFGRLANGLPMGIQVMGAQGQDGLLLQLAAQVERALGGQWNGGAVPAHHVTRG